MASISSPGIGTGMDVNAVIAQLMSIERQPIAALQKAANTIQTRISTFGTLKSNVSALRDAADALTKSSTWSQTQATSSDSAAVSPSTTANTKPGNYSVQVNTLAASQSVASSSYAAAATVVGEGTLTLQLGSWSGAAFTAKSGSSPTNITVAAGTTVSGLRDAINAANAGVTASLLNDASGYRLVLRSTDTGAVNGFKLTASDPSATGLANVAYDPSTSTTPMTLATAAANATGTINGLAVSSSTNTFTEVVDGLTMTFGKTTTSPVLVSTKVDTEAIKKQITAFTTAYNTLNSFIATQTAYDPVSKRGGTLQADSSVNSIRGQIRAVLGATAGISSTFTRLSDVGVALQRDGSLLAGSTLDQALANIDEARKLFGNIDATTPANNGLATQLRSLTDRILSADGAISNRTSGLQTSLRTNQTRQDDIENRVQLTEKRMRAQFVALDASMAKINGTSSFVNQMIAQYNSNKG
jgi:flagellar hook-associated protein 2